VEVETPFRFEVGDSIYKVSSKEAFTLSENACLARLKTAQGAGASRCMVIRSLQVPTHGAPQNQHQEPGPYKNKLVLTPHNGPHLRC